MCLVVLGVYRYGSSVESLDKDTVSKATAQVEQSLSEEKRVFEGWCRSVVQWSYYSSLM